MLEAKAESEDKILASRPACLQGLNITEHASLRTVLHSAASDTSACLTHCDWCKVMCVKSTMCFRLWS